MLSHSCSVVLVFPHHQQATAVAAYSQHCFSTLNLHLHNLKGFKGKILVTQTPMKTCHLILSCQQGQILAIVKPSTLIFYEGLPSITLPSSKLFKLHLLTIRCVLLHTMQHSFLIHTQTFNNVTPADFNNILAFSAEYREYCMAAK